MAETGFADDFKRNFLTGVAALFPILIVVILFSWLYRQLDATIGKGANVVCYEVLARTPAAFEVAFPKAPERVLNDVGARRRYARSHFPRAVGVVVALCVTVLAVYLFGSFLRGYVGRRIMHVVDRFFERFPVIRAIYPHARQVADVLFGQSRQGRFNHVVAVEYPRRGAYSLGFMTGEGLGQLVQATGEEDLATVFVPTSPTPLTGFIIVVPRREVVELNMSVDEAFRYCVTAGMLVSGGQELRQRPEGSGSGT
jgi:uncharacterized membrane protein